MDTRQVGERIKYFRDLRKMNRNQLANYAGVSPTYIYQLEKGEKSPTIEYLGHICWALNISLSEFFALEQQSSEDKLSSLSPTQKSKLNDFLNSLK